MDDKDLSLSEWIQYAFDHPVGKPAWYWEIDAPYWAGNPSRVAALIAETFEHSGDLLAGFSDAQLDQAFCFLVSSSCSEYMFALIDTAVPWSLRLRALRSMIPLFEQTMAVRCSPHLLHLDEPGANALNSSCYMWWDMIPIHGRPDMADRAAFDSEVLSVLRRILALPHDACRESALHGLGHWQIYYHEATQLIDDFLRITPNLRVELVRYAESARRGHVN